MSELGWADHEELAADKAVALTEATARAEKAEADLARLREQVRVLAQYARHYAGCLTTVLGTRPGVCGCGLGAALAAVKEADDD